MLLKALYDFAHSRPLLGNLAFAPKSIRWVIQIDAEGNLTGAGPLDISEDGKRGPEFPAPRATDPNAKNAGGIADFLVEELDAIFGLATDPENPLNDRQRKNLQKKHEHFWQMVEQSLSETQIPELEAILTFHREIRSTPSFLRWGISQSPKNSEKKAWWLMTAKGEEIRFGGENFTFQIGNSLLLNNDDLRQWWVNFFQREVNNKDTGLKRGLCLITGNDDLPIALTHSPKIKAGKGGVYGAQSSGAALVSFDKDAFTSYGFVQSRNAPISTDAATAYCVALNHLLGSDKHSLRIGGMTVCFWARNSEEATDVFAWAFDQPKPESVRDFLNAPRTGVQRSLSEPDDFYSVTLSGNGGRVVVRHWMQMPVENAVINLQCWFTDLDIVTYGFSSNTAVTKRKAKKTDDADEDNTTAKSGKEATPPLGLYRLACVTVREAKNLQADVPAQLYRAALEGTAPPLSLLKPILNRLKADLCKFGAGILETPISSKVIKAMTDSKTPLPPPGQSRMALIRMILNRNSRTRKEGEQMIEPQVFETDDSAYNCGRLLAVLAEAQQKAHDYDLNTGIAERYFGMACASPSSVIPLLIRLNRHHLSKISKSAKYKGHERFLEEAIQNILALFRPKGTGQPPVFPRTLDLQAQGRFALGFYQQQAADDAARRANNKGNNNPPQSN